MTGSLCLGSFGFAGEEVRVVQASTISDIQNDLKNHQDTLNQINGKIDSLQDEQDLIQEAIDDLNAEIINTMTSIGLKEDEIAQKETEIGDKQVEIDATQLEYEAAVEREEKQRESMASNTRMMYENNNDSYLNLILSGNGLGDILNRMNYIEKVYEYSKNRLESYKEAKEQVQALWDLLEQQKWSPIKRIWRQTGRSCRI